MRRKGKADHDVADSARDGGGAYCAALGSLEAEKDSKGWLEDARYSEITVETSGTHRAGACGLRDELVEDDFLTNRAYSRLEREWKSHSHSSEMMWQKQIESDISRRAHSPA